MLRELTVLILLRNTYTRTRQRTPVVNPLNPELNPICYLLALLAHHFLHVSRIRVKSLTIRLLMSYYYYYLAGCTTFPHLPAPVEHL